MLSGKGVVVDVGVCTTPSRRSAAAFRPRFKPKLASVWSWSVSGTAAWVLVLLPRAASSLPFSCLISHIPYQPSQRMPQPKGSAQLPKRGRDLC